MDLGLKDQVVIIAETRSCVGRAGAILFVEQGARVVISDINGDDGQETVRQIETARGQAFFMHCGLYGLQRLRRQYVLPIKRQEENDDDTNSTPSTPRDKFP